MPRNPQVASLQTFDEIAMKAREQGAGDRGRDGINRDRRRGLPGDSMEKIGSQASGAEDLLSCAHANAMRSRNTNAREVLPTG